MLVFHKRKSVNSRDNTGTESDCRLSLTETLPVVPSELTIVVLVVVQIFLFSLVGKGPDVHSRN